MDYVEVDRGADPRTTAILLLAAAVEQGLNPARVVRTDSFGHYLVPKSVAAAVNGKKIKKAAPAAEQEQAPEPVADEQALPAEEQE